MKKTIQQALRAIEKARDGSVREIDSSAGAIFMRLAALSRQLATFHGQVLKSEGVATSEYQLLALLWAQGPCAPKDLNQLLLLTSGALTNALDRLQKAGHVRRRPNREDARSVFIELTPAGSRLAERLVALESEAQTRQLNQLTRAEKREVVDALDQLIDVF
jgi:DNA-binding MarR family transcriptional regulator